MKYRTLVFGTSINDDNDVRRIAGLLDGNGRIRKWSVDLEDWEKVLRIECCGLSANTVSRLLRRYGYECYELEYLPNEILRLGMLAKTLAVLSLLVLLAMPCRAQVITSRWPTTSVRRQQKTSRVTVRSTCFGETKWAHDYNLTLDGKDVEKRRKKNLAHTEVLYHGANAQAEEHFAVRQPAILALYVPDIRRQTVCFRAFCKRWPFGLRKVLFWTVKGHLLQAEIRYFANALSVVCFSVVGKACIKNCAAVCRNHENSNIRAARPLFLEYILYLCIQVK